MSKQDQYIVRHSQVGAHREGALVTEADFPDEENLNRLIGLGALGKPTEEELAARAKDAEIGSDAPQLATGQPGGAPIGEGTAAQNEANARPARPVNRS